MYAKSAEQVQQITIGNIKPVDNMYNGKEKCVGCNKSGEENPRSQRNQLCRSCENIFRLGKSYKKTYDELNADDIVLVSFRSVHLMKLSTVYRSEQNEILNKFILSFLKTVCITDDWQLIRGNYSEEFFLGVSATSCAWIKGLFYRKHYEMIELLVYSIDKFINEYIGDVKKLEEAAYQKGQNLLMSMNNDNTFLDKINHASSIK